MTGKMEKAAFAAQAVGYAMMAVALGVATPLADPNKPAEHSVFAELHAPNLHGR